MKTTKAPRHCLCAGNSPVTGEFTAQRANNAEQFAICWRHHDQFTPMCYHIEPGWRISSSMTWESFAHIMAHTRFGIQSFPTDVFVQFNSKILQNKKVAHRWPSVILKACRIDKYYGKNEWYIQTRYTVWNTATLHSPMSLWGRSSSYIYQSNDVKTPDIKYLYTF